MTPHDRGDVDGVAIVGIGCRFPGGADTPERFWDLLCRGVDAITEAPPTRFDMEALFDADPGRAGKLYARWGGFIEGIENFDADFFGISPREARRIDPQHRLLLEVTWEALEDGGQPPDRLAGTETGVFVGIASQDYAHIQARPDHRALIDAHVNVGSATSLAANRVSYLLDLRGPSVAVDTACSSALTALHLAVRSLRSGECGLAVVGGVNALLVAEPTIGFCKAAMLSPRGRCRPFDAGADGYVRSEGAGAIVLKPLSRALEEGDPVYAVIRATAINQDGRTPGIGVPSVEAQQELLRRALGEAGLEAREVQYVEAHGTGTPVGDPREARAIGTVMGAGRPAERPCLIGSVKGNVGHLEAAAGIVGLIKAALALRHRQIPPSIHHVEPNPAISFEGLHLRVPTTLEAWPHVEGRAVAGVNSFGFGGANAHAILEEAPPLGRHARPRLADTDHILTLSARSAGALLEVARDHARFLAEDDSAPLSDVCFTAATRRSHHQHRLAAVGRSKRELAALLEAFGAEQDERGLVSGRCTSDGAPKVAFVFSGMGPQWWGMGRELLHDEAVFRGVVEECDRLVGALGGWSLLGELAAGEADSRIAEPRIAHVANFALQVALAALWRSWGIVPEAVVGHSSGEMAAACVAGALDLPDGVRLAFHRGRLQQRAAGTGGMLAAGISRQAAMELIDGHERQVSLAAVNSPTSVTLSGDLHALAEIAAALAKEERFHRQLSVSVPYHGPQMEDLRDEFIAALEGLDPQPPAVRLISTVTGTSQGGRLDAGYWWHNMRDPVLFSTAVDRLVAEGVDAFVEVSPHPVLAPSVAECLEANGRDGMVLPSLRRGEGERAVMLRALAALHVRGRPVRWPGVFAGGSMHVRLPTYPWQRERHWFEPGETGSYSLAGRDSGHALLGRRLRGARPMWEADLGDPRVAYLDGHLVHGRPTLPGAAYVEMGLATTQALRGGGPSVLEQVEFHRPVGLSDRGDVSLQCLVDERESAIEIHSGSKTEPPGWTLRASARLAGAPPGPSEPVDMAAVRERCPTPMEPESYYAWLEERLGLRYDGAFRGLRELRRGDGEALGEIALPDADDLAGDGYSVHPALLDSAFHVLGAAAAGALDDRDVGTLLPMSIARVEYHGSPGERFFSHARMTHREGSVVEGSVDLLDDAGTVRLRCEGVRLKVLEDAPRESIGDWFYEDRWEPAARPHVPGAIPRPARGLLPVVQAQFDRSRAECAFDDYYTEIGPALDSLASGLVLDALRQLGFDPLRDAEADPEALSRRLGVPPRHRRFLTRLIDIAVAAGPARRGRRSELLVGEGPYSSAVELVRASGERLARTLRGMEDAREWLVAGEFLPALVELYGVSPVFRVYGEAVADAVAAIADAARPRTLRVLEVGAGTGGTTKLVLERLPPGTVEYVFSDVSAFFLRLARKRFGDRPELRTQILDVEDPRVEAGTFDVVIAADVVHATADVRGTLRGLCRLLAPGGTLLLLEGIRRSVWTDLVFGQFEGWWRFSDTDLRRDCALLSIPEWKRVLGEAGFTGAACIADEPPAGGDPAQAVLVAHARSDETAPPLARHWLVLTDRRGVGPEVAAALRERGDRCTLVWPGSSYRRYGADGMELSPSGVADWERLLREVDEVDGMIHLWSLDAPNEASAAELLAFQETTCGSVVALLQALASTKRALPDVWLVTAGAQTAGVADREVRPAQAPLWGLGRVLRNEQGGRRCRMVDLGAAFTDQDIDALLAELESVADGEGELAFRNGRRLARRQGRMTADLLGPAQGRSTVSPSTSSFGLACRVPGSLDTLHLRETESAEPAPDEVAIRVMAAGLNLRDVLVALGMAFAAGRDDVGQEVLGWECAGIVEACGENVNHVRPGDEVVAIAGGALGSRVIAQAGHVVRKPPLVRFEEAATLPVAFVTAEYALSELARIASGERVLVHSASGGVGLAALQVARRAGAEVFATAGTPEKRAYLESLGVRAVMDSRSLAFADEVLRRTGGEGVDVVLNSLPGEAIAKGLSILRPHGRFIELGKRDIHEDRQLRLRPFRNNRSFHGLDLYALFLDRPGVVDPMLRSIVHDIEKGLLVPLPHQDFDIGEAETAFRLMAQARHIGKVVLTVRRPRYSAVPRERAPLFHRDGTYLLVGGLGGFGIAVADWIVRHGARHLVLTSRTGRPHEEDVQALEALRDSQATVETSACDAGDPVATGRLLDHIRATMPTLKGVMHAAMVLDDDLLGKLDYRRFEPVLAPKIAGAWNLHALTLKDDLDLFVLFSSISGFVGQPGQSSYAAASVFLDALAEHRRALGRPALAVDFGAIEGVGYMSRHGDIQRRLQRQGLAGLRPDEACAALEELLRGGITRACVARVDLATWTEHAAAAPNEVAPDGRPSPEQRSGEGEPLRMRVAAAPSDERTTMLERYLVERTARVLETSPVRVDTDRPLPEMGLDSLMAVELRTAIRVDLGLDVPIVDLLEGMSLRKLAGIVLAGLEKQ